MSYDLPSPGVYEPGGLRFVDGKTGREMLLIDQPGHVQDGWMCWRHPDGQWVTLRKATDADRVRILEAKIDALSKTHAPDCDLASALGRTP